MKFSFALILIFNIVVLLSSCSRNEHDSSAIQTDFCSSIHRDASVSLSAELAHLEEKMKTETGVYVLEDGSGSMVARAWLSEYAEKTIDIQYFIFSTDNVGLIACDYLVRAADRGVKVRILVDDIMVDAESEDIIKFSAHENISLKIYNPGVNLGKNLFQKGKKLLTEFRSANQRMHNKTFIVDGNVVITGGRNIANEYFDYDHKYNFRDRDILLIGNEVNSVSSSFDQFWNSELSIDIANVISTEEKLDPNPVFETLHEYACNPENFWPQVRERIAKLPQTFDQIKYSGQLVWLKDIEFVSDLPGKNDGAKGYKGGGGLSTEKLIELVNSAEQSIDIQTPYLITTELGQSLFKAAVDRGVKLRILTNSLSSTDNVEAFSSYQSDRETLLKTGVRIFEFKPDAEIRKKVLTGELQDSLKHQPIFGLHAKSMVIDGETTVIGTFNLDPRSANLNTECIVVVKSKQVSQGVSKGMEEEFKPENAWEVTLEFNPDSEVGRYKRLKTWTRKIIPKGIL